MVRIHLPLPITMTNKKTYKRYFLNPGEGIAAASFEVSLYKDLDRQYKHTKEPDPTLHVEASISLSDCSRQINLEFEIWNPEDKKEAKKVLRRQRAKLKRFKQIVDDFVEATSSAYDEMDKSLNEYYTLKQKQ